MPFAPSAQTQAVPHDLSDDDLGESDSDLETRITQRQRDLYVSRYGDTLSDSEDDDLMSLKRPPPPPLQPVPAQPTSKRPRRAQMDEKSYQMQIQQQQVAAAQAQAQAQIQNALHAARGGKIVRSFFPP